MAVIYFPVCWADMPFKCWHFICILVQQSDKHLFKSQRKHFIRQIKPLRILNSAGSKMWNEKKREWDRDKKSKCIQKLPLLVEMLVFNYMLSHLLSIVLQLLRLKWCEVRVYSVSQWISSCIHIKLNISIIGLAQLPHFKCPKCSCTSANYCYRMHLKYAQHTQMQKLWPIVISWCILWGCFIRNDSFRMSVYFFASSMDIFGNVIAIHSLLFLVKFIFWSFFLSMKSITLPFIACEKLPPIDDFFSAGVPKSAAQTFGSVFRHLFRS